MTTMRPIRAGLLSLALLVGVPAAARSEDPGAAAGKRALPLRECVQTALRSNPGLMATSQERDAARGRTAQARSSLLPQINGSGSASISESPERQSLVGGELRSSPKNRYQQQDLGLSVEQSLFDLSSWKSAASARASQDATDASYLTSQEDLVLSVERAYYSYLKAIHLQEVAEENLKVGEEQLKLAEKRREVGIGVEADILKARAQHATDQLGLINAEKQVKIARTTLNHVMGIALDTPLVVEDLPADEGPAEPPAPDVEGALALRPDLATQRHRVRAAELSFSAARARRLPNLGFSFGYTRLLDAKNKTYDQVLSDSKAFLDPSDNSISFVSTPTDTVDLVTNTDAYGSWRASVALSLPIFTGGSTRGRINESRAQMISERDNLLQLERNARLEIETATLTVAAAARAIDVSRDGVRAAEEDLRVTQGSYTQGILPILNLVQSKAALVESKSAFVSATYDYRIALAELDRALGRGVVKYAE